MASFGPLAGGALQTGPGLGEPADAGISKALLPSNSRLGGRGVFGVSFSLNQKNLTKVGKVWREKSLDMQYLRKFRGKKSWKAPAHLWVEGDTLCRLWSTGGIQNKENFRILDKVGDHKICLMCRNVAECGVVMPDLREIDRGTNRYIPSADERPPWE